MAHNVVSIICISNKCMCVCLKRQKVNVIAIQTSSHLFLEYFCFDERLDENIGTRKQNVFIKILMQLDSRFLYSFSNYPHIMLNDNYIVLMKCIHK